MFHLFCCHLNEAWHWWRPEIALDLKWNPSDDLTMLWKQLAFSMENCFWIFLSVFISSVLRKWIWKISWKQFEYQFWITIATDNYRKWTKCLCNIHFLCIYEINNISRRISKNLIWSLFAGFEWMKEIEWWRMNMASNSNSVERTSIGLKNEMIPFLNEL